MKYSAIILLSGVLTTSITGCGGGGGGGNHDESSSEPTPTPTPTSTPTSNSTLTITADNAVPVASDVLTMATSTMAFGVGFINTPSTSTPLDQRLNVVAIVEKQLVLINSMMSNKASALDLSPQANSVRTHSCPNGGQIIVTTNDNDNNGVLSQGDTVSEQFQNCQEADGSISNGTVSLQVSLAQGDFMDKVPPYNAQLVFNLSGFNVVTKISSLTMEGDMILAFRDQDNINSLMDVSGGSLGLDLTASGTKIVSGTLSNYSFHSTTNQNTSQCSITYDNSILNDSILGGSVDFQTTQPFQCLGGPHPSQGVMVINGASGSNETMTVIDSTNVQLAVDVNGDGISEQTIPTTWNALLK